ncbi:MAG: hypothetical protein RQ864_12050 [Lutibacter sp.]|nr:hypothetical protein [Lutibacter sp.]MDT8418530.1 hypothetical protein [Lutibacter sp.]
MYEENSFERKKKMPLYKKAQEIMEISLKKSESVSKHDIENLDEAEGEMLEGYAQYIRENATIIPAKISGAEAVEIYDLKMENAAIIRKAARELSTYCTGLAMCGYKNTDYLQLLRDEIEEFRGLFAEWVKTFDQWNYLFYSWGLFNPPGIDYDTHDPDDDIF